MLRGHSPRGLDLSCCWESLGRWRDHAGPACLRAMPELPHHPPEILTLHGVMCYYTMLMLCNCSPTCRATCHFAALSGVTLEVITIAYNTLIFLGFCLSFIVTLILLWSSLSVRCQHIRHVSQLIYFSINSTLRSILYFYSNGLHSSILCYLTRTVSFSFITSSSELVNIPVHFMSSHFLYFILQYLSKSSLVLNF